MALTFRLEWQRSTSDDVTDQKLHLTVDDGEEQIIDLGPEASSYDLSLDDGQSVAWFVRTFDDADNHSDSETRTFLAEDKIPPEPATGLTVVPTGETSEGEE